jgi:hypothetical protein
MNAGIGIDGKGFFQFKGENVSVLTNSKDWHLGETEDSSRIWWRNSIGHYNTFKKPLSDAVFSKLITNLKFNNIPGRKLWDIALGEIYR